MIYIDFEGKTPFNTSENSEIPEWKPWTKEEWEEWLSQSKTYLDTITALNRQGKTKERNDFIDGKSAHWGKLKLWLQVLSHGKCWFSEVRELYSHYDVEHFRPKVECRDIHGAIKDGYWWLAFEYTNYRLCGNVGNRKKRGWFPLKPDSLCSTFERPCEESETYYLLDPTDPDDPALIAFDEEGKAIPSPLCQSDWEKERAGFTIARLKLSEHERLTEARKKIWQTVTMEIEQYQTAKAKLALGCNPGVKEKVKAHLKKIKDMVSPTAELSSVAKWCIHFRNDNTLQKLVF
jgi:hypothetical protein